MDPDACDVDRSPLGEMPAEDYYEEGCDGTEAFVVLDDVYEEVPENSEVHDHVEGACEAAASTLKSVGDSTFDFSTVPQIQVNEEPEKGKGKSVEELLGEKDKGLSARVLEPIEKAEEGWKIWESGSVSGGE